MLDDRKIDENREHEISMIFSMPPYCIGLRACYEVVEGKVGVTLGWGVARLWGDYTQDTYHPYFTPKYPITQALNLMPYNYDIGCHMILLLIVQFNHLFRSSG